MRNVCVVRDPSASVRLRGCEKILRHPESAKRDEGSQNAKSLQFRDPSPSTRLRMTDFFSQPLITMTKSLYICYFGLREPLVQTQVLPYLRELAKSGVAIFLLTFEPERWDDAQMRDRK